MIDKITEAWNAFVALPRCHPMEVQEGRTFVHGLQGLVMNRAAVRAHPETFHHEPEFDIFLPHDYSPLSPVMGCSNALSADVSIWRVRMPIDKVTGAINELILAANAWDSAWRATHGKSFTAGDTAMEALVGQRDRAEEDLSAAVYRLNSVYNEPPSPSDKGGKAK